METHTVQCAREWIIHVRRTLEEEGHEDNNDLGIPVSIFDAPKSLVSIKKEAYFPHIVALGPYHRRRSELLEMERYKVSSARRIQHMFNHIKFVDLVKHFMLFDRKTRSHYHRFLDVDAETLSWMLAIDSCFLLEYLRVYSDTNKAGLLGRVSSMMAHLIDHTRRKSVHHAILRDIVMLENQIPLFLMKEVFVFCYHDNSHEELVIMKNCLVRFCNHLSPLKIRCSKYFIEACLNRSHLLELVYDMVTSNMLAALAEIEECEKENKSEEIGCVVKTFQFIINGFITIHRTIFSFLARLCKSKVVALISKIIKCSFRLKSNVTEQLQNVSHIITDEGTLIEETSSIPNVNSEDGAPLIEEITIPSVTELSNIGVKFIRSSGGLETIKFDKRSGEFYLPVMHLDDNSEVVLRNLVAYEACIAPEAMVFTRYTELMAGIVDTKEDVKILRHAGIILNRLKSDDEVANLWNGMTKSVEITKVPILDKAIEGVNEYYSSLLKVKIKRGMKKYVFGSWRFLTFLAANLLILMSAVETICSMYNCSKH